jgi:hypothetical protein
MMSISNEELFNKIFQKGSLKQDIYQITLESIRTFKKEAKKLVKEYPKTHGQNMDRLRIPVTFQDRGEFEFELRFGGDVLLFIMHTNIFEIPRNHEIRNTRYIKDDTERSYCGMLHIYNFLADSFKYGREDDAGYLIGRLMVNKENHYFIEGKKEIGMIYHHFENSILDKEAIQQIISSAMEYTVNFDLLIPPYEAVQIISVADLQLSYRGRSLRTAKRMGFKFQADKKEVKGMHSNE